MLSQSSDNKLNIYAITPSFSDDTLLKTEDYFASGNSLLQLRDKTADKKKTIEFIKKVCRLKHRYKRAKLVFKLL